MVGRVDVGDTLLVEVVVSMGVIVVGVTEELLLVVEVLLGVEELVVVVDIEVMVEELVVVFDMIVEDMLVVVFVYMLVVIFADMLVVVFADMLVVVFADMLVVVFAKEVVIGTELVEEFVNSIVDVAVVVLSSELINAVTL